MCYQLLPHVLAGRLCREPVALVLPVFFLDCAPLACPPACMRVCVRVNVCSETSVCAMTGKPATDREGEGVGGRQLTDVFIFVPSSGLDSRTLGPYILKLQYRKMRSPDNH